MRTSGTGTLRGLKETVLSFKPECYYIYRIYLKTNELNTNGCFLNVRIKNTFLILYVKRGKRMKGINANVKSNKI